MGWIFAGGIGLLGLFFGLKNSDPEQIAKNLDKTFNSLNEVIQGAIDLVTKPIDSIDGIWNVLTSVHNAILPVGFSLLTLFFLLGLMSRSMSFKIIRVEDIIKLLIRAIIAKVVMQGSFELLNMIYSMVTSTIITAGFSVAPIKIVDTTALAEQISQMSFFEKIQFQTQFTPISLIMFFLNLMVFVLCYGRIIELCIFTAVSPIPIATLSSEEYSSTAKRFFQHYIAVCLQGLIIVIICMAYGGLAQTLIGNIKESSDFGVGSSIALSIMLIFVLSKSEAWAKQIVGVN